ncbi:MAG: small multi-drug export protein, partial [Clostridia bacterium]
SIPVAISMGINPFLALTFAWLGTGLVAPVLLLLLRPVLNWMKKFRPFRAIAEGLESIFDGKATKVAAKATSVDPKVVERKKLWGVFAFVAVPLPMTGVWTGSAVAVFMGLPFWKSMLAILAGNLVAGVIITLLAFYLSAYMDIILTAFLIIVLVVLLLFVTKLILKIVANKKLAAKNAENNADKTTEKDELNNADKNNIDKKNADKTNINNSGNNADETIVDGGNEKAQIEVRAIVKDDKDIN